jgi:NAD(P)-dependent dehydrogenase (short-subunit alcohol dehydrogenase family)
VPDLQKTQMALRDAGPDLRGQVAVVTGGGRGLGRAFAQALAAAGCSVAVAARSDAELAETVRLVERSGGHARAFTADVTDAGAVDKAFAEIEQLLGPVDLFVNNAGIAGPIGPFTQSRVGISARSGAMSPNRPATI